MKDRAVSKVEHLRCQGVVNTGQNILVSGENLYAESQECCNAFLACSVEAAKQCEASHARMTSYVMELRAQLNKCISCTDELDFLKAAKEMQTMWSIFSEMESNMVIVKQSFEEKAVRDRLTKAGLLPAIKYTKKELVTEPSRDAVMKGAVITGDDQGVKAMIVQGCDVNASTTGGYTLLHEAAERGFTKITKLLIYGGADVTRQTAKGSTPLITAASFGHAATVGVGHYCSPFFLNLSPSALTFIKVNKTSYFICVEELCTQVMLQAGADPNATNHKGYRALHIACKNGHGGKEELSTLCQKRL